MFVAFDRCRGILIIEMFNSYILGRVSRVSLSHVHFSQLETSTVPYFTHLGEWWPCSQTATPCAQVATPCSQPAALCTASCTHHLTPCT